jgi:hypothetical protein
VQVNGTSPVSALLYAWPWRPLELSALKAYAQPNKVVSQFAKVSLAEWTNRIWDCLNDRGKFVRPPSLVQLFNPQSARGYSLLKPSCTYPFTITLDRSFPTLRGPYRSDRQIHRSLRDTL